jgi:choline dehydrogenase-like flavoprotein
LDDSLDRLGLNRVRVDWRSTELDRRTIAVTLTLMGEELGRLGVGRVGIRRFVREGTMPWHESTHGGGHHMGTTRMSEDPTAGVVDPSCRVHGTDNLYVASSAVFPRAGCVNPTLTIVALSLRLADHLREVLR